MLASESGDPEVDLLRSRHQDFRRNPYGARVVAAVEAGSRDAERSATVRKIVSGNEGLQTHLISKVCSQAMQGPR